MLSSVSVDLRKIAGNCALLLLVALAGATGCSGSEDRPVAPVAYDAAHDAGADAPSGPDGTDEIESGGDRSSAADALAETSAPDGPAEALDDVAGDSAVLDAPVDSTSAMPPMPMSTLAATGLFTGINADGTLKFAGGVEPFEPKYALWSDGADKTRWVYLPPGSKIDTSDPDHWSLPVGTKFWKEFSISGKRVETRLIERFGPGPNDFLYAAYWWKPNDAGQATDASLASPDDGVPSANGTTHDIPARKHCAQCHDALQEHILGFGALELAHTRPGATVTTLAQAGRFTKPLPSNLDFPGPDAMTKDALGYLHANCGNCHNTTPGVFMIPEPRMVLRVFVGQALADTGAYKTALNAEVTKYMHPMAPTIQYRIAGGDAAHSCVSFRMTSLTMTDRMPPIASKVADTRGIAAVNAWIATLPPPPNP